MEGRADAGAIASRLCVPTVSVLSGSSHSGRATDPSLTVTGIAITGGSGFIGRHLIDALSGSAIPVRVLTRAPGVDHPSTDNVTWVRGDVEDAGALRALMAPGGVLVNLAYPRGWTLERHVAAADRVAAAAISVGLKRFVHCSTVSVWGRAPALRIVESTPCQPVTDYELSKLAVERTLAAELAQRCEFVVLRPTAVFGPRGQNLVKLATALRSKRRYRNYLRSSLFGRRPMNLVCVDNVVAALQFLINYPGICPDDVYIVSDDDDPLNNFLDVERELMRLLRIRPYAVPQLPIPRFLLAAALRVAGRHSVGGRRHFDSSQLRRAGYTRRTTLAAGLESFVDWFDQGR